MIISTLSPIERPLRYTVTSTKVQFKQGNIETVIGLRPTDPKGTPKVLTTTLKPNSALEPEEVKTLIKLNLGTFKIENDPTQALLRKGFVDDMFFNGNRFVEIIRDGEIVGYNIFEIIYLNNRVYLYCSFADILSTADYSSCGIMSFLGWRNAFVFHQIFRDNVVGLCFLGADFNSIRQVQNHLYWPMYQPNHMKQEVIGLVAAIEGGVMYHRGLACYVKDQVMVKAKSRDGFFSRYYYKYVLDQSVHSSGYKAAPVLTYITDRTHNLVSQLCERMRINIDDHIHELTKAFYPFLTRKSFTPDQTGVYLEKRIYSEARTLFWCNKRIPANDRDKYIQKAKQTKAKL